MHVKYLQCIYLLILCFAIGLRRLKCNPSDYIVCVWYIPPRNTNTVCNRSSLGKVMVYPEM